MVKARVLELLAARPADELSITAIVNLMRGDDEVSPDDPELFGEVRAAVKELRADNKITGRVDGGQCFYAAAIDKPGTRIPDKRIREPQPPAPKKPETPVKEKPRSRRSIKLETARAHILAALEKHDTMQDIAAMTAKGISKAVTFKALSELKAEDRVFGIKGGPKVGSRYGLKAKTYSAAPAFGKPKRKPHEAPAPEAKPAKPKINGHASRKAPPDVGVKADLGARFGFWSDGSLQIATPGCAGTLSPGEFNQLLKLIDNSRARTSA